MNNEKILVAMELYIASLTEAERSAFNQSELGKVKEELHRENEENARKKLKGSDFVKRSKRLSKILAGCDAFAGNNTAWSIDFHGEKKQCVVPCGAYGFMFNEPLDLPTDETINRLDMNKFFDVDFSQFIEQKVNFSEVKTQYNAFRKSLTPKQRKNKLNRCVVQIGDKYFNAEYLIDTMEVLGGNITFYQHKNQRQYDILVSENGSAVICPLNKK